MAKTTSGGASDAGAPFSLPADLGGLTVEQLAELRTSARTELAAIIDAGRQREDLPRATQLAADIKKLDKRKGEIEAETAETAAEFDRITGEIDLAEPVEAEAVAEPAAVSDPAAAPAGEVLEGELIDQTPQLVTASGARPTGGAVTASRDTGGLSGPKHRLNPSLSGARAVAPAQSTAVQEQLAITASVGMPGQFEAGARINDLNGLGGLFEQRARNMGDAQGNFRRRRHDDPYGGVQIASIANQFADVLSDKSSGDAVQAYIEKVQGNRLASKMESLVAAGGWCAPSQIRYDFFNIACESGMIDLPTFGVERGGVNFPISPSLADTFSPALPWYTAFSSSTVPWLWTETDDIAAVTGSPTKPCIRVPCSTMSDRRLECYGICLTAGNLADNAWPESTRNFLRLLMAAHYHAQNARYISTIASFATGASAITGATAAGAGVIAPLLFTDELGAIDYRNKYGMCENDVIEVIRPQWAIGAIRADLAKRTGVSDFMNVPLSEVERWYDTRNIRLQLVADYQVRAGGQPGAATPITAYPSTMNSLLYAAGTVARGNGMNLDLGVVRDSTLNAKNDFTAAWMEECHLIARFGHEVRQYTVNICPDGTTGAADLTACV